MSTNITDQTIESPTIRGRRGGITFLRALGLLFIGLKLGGAVSWPWLLVLLPLYGPFVALVVVPAIIASAIVVAAGFAKGPAN